METKRNKIIWKDFHIFRIILLILELALITFFITLLSKIRIEFSITLILLLLYIIISLGFLFNIFRTKLTYITEDGIRIGNAVNDMYVSLKLKKAVFLRWSQIKFLKIKRREVERTLAKELIDILIIKTKSNEKFECFIANPSGFIKSIRKIRKSNLIDDSRYLKK